MLQLSTKIGRIWENSSLYSMAKVTIWKQKVTKWLQIVKFLTSGGQFSALCTIWEKIFLNFCAIFFLTIFRNYDIIEVRACGAC